MKMSYTPLPHLEIMSWDIGPKYRALSYLGHGSYGSVCKALRVADEKQVAIKKMKLYLSETDSFRILREVQLLRRLKNPCIVELLDLFFSGDKENIYLVLELGDADLKKCINSASF
jgi:serine/threonine protein kinase